MDFTQFTYSAGEAKRENHAVYNVIDPTKPLVKDNLELLGHRIEDMGMDMNPEADSGKDVTGASYNDITGYEPSMTINPLLVSDKSKYAQKVNERYIALATLDDLKFTYLVVLDYMTNASGEKCAYLQEANMSMDTIAEGIKGVQMNHTVNFIGKRTLGTFDPAAYKDGEDEVFLADTSDEIIYS